MCVCRAHRSSVAILAGKKEASVEVRGSQSRSIIAQICEKNDTAAFTVHSHSMSHRGSNVKGRVNMYRCYKAMRLNRSYSVHIALVKHPRSWAKMVAPVAAVCCSSSWKTLASKSHKSYVCVRGKCAFLLFFLNTDLLIVFFNVHYQTRGLLIHCPWNLAVKYVPDNKFAFLHPSVFPLFPSHPAAVPAVVVPFACVYKSRVLVRLKMLVKYDI